MTYFASKEKADIEQCPGHLSYTMLTEDNGCTNSCICGISCYTTTDYHEPGCHDMQEGFVVLSGEGTARVGEEEGVLRRGVSFIVPAGVPHVIRAARADVPIEVFWFHAAT